MVEQVKVSVLGLNAPRLSGQAAEMIPPGFVIPAYRRLCRARIASVRAARQRQRLGDRNGDCSGGLGLECPRAKEITFCLAMPRCW